MRNKKEANYICSIDINHDSIEGCNLCYQNGSSLSPEFVTSLNQMAGVSPIIES